MDGASQADPRIGGPRTLAGPPRSSPSSGRSKVATAGPFAPAGIARCRGYDPDDVLRGLEAIMGRIGGLRGPVASKAVVVELNIIGDPRRETPGRPARPDLPSSPLIRIA